MIILPRTCHLSTSQIICLGAEEPYYCVYFYFLTFNINKCSYGWTFVSSLIIIKITILKAPPFFFCCVFRVCYVKLKSLEVSLCMVQIKCLMHPFLLLYGASGQGPQEGMPSSCAEPSPSVSEVAGHSKGSGSRAYPPWSFSSRSIRWRASERTSHISKAISTTAVCLCGLKCRSSSP